MANGSTVLKEHAQCFMSHLRQKGFDLRKKFTLDDLKDQHDKMYPGGHKGTFTYVRQILSRAGALMMAPDGTHFVFDVTQEVKSCPPYSQKYVQDLRSKLQLMDQQRVMTSSVAALPEWLQVLKARSTPVVSSPPKKTKQTPPQKLVVVDQYVSGARAAVEKEKFRCKDCKRNFKSSKALEQHSASQKHRVSILLQKFRTHRSEFICDKNGVVVSSEFDTVDGCVRIPVEKKVEKEIVITIKNENIKADVDILMCRYLRKMRGFKVDGFARLRLPPGDSHRIRARVTCHGVGTFIVPLCLHLQLQGKDFHIVRSLKAVCSNALVRDLLPTIPYEKPAYKVNTVPSTSIEDGLLPPRSGSSKLQPEVPLPQFPMTNDLQHLLNSGLKQTKAMSSAKAKSLAGIKSLLEAPMSMKQYAKRFSLLLHIEEHQMQLDIRRYDMEGVTMQVFKEDKKLLCLDVPGVAEKRPSVLPHDHLFVCPLTQNGVRDRTEYKGYVHRVLNERVALGFGKKLMAIFLPNMKFAVRFVVNRYPLRMQHRAVQLAVEHNCMPWLFPTPGSIGMHPLVSDISSLKLKLYDRKLEANKQQFQAVQHIVAGTARPGPYLVFGPPGTGKSVTLVEAMKQVLGVYRDAHLLVCAPSNSAADLLAERLLPHVDKRSILRLNAPSRIAMSIPETIKDCSNYIHGEGVYFPSKEDLLDYRVIVSTLITAGRIASANFPSGHFTHVFIDECGQAQETEGVVALAGILDNHLVNPSGGHLILAGDPRQLGPVLRSPAAKDYGLDNSLLERLMDDTEVYSPENAHCFTKLLKNYRSHPAILKLPSQLFYNDELEPCADLVLRNSLCNWEGLPKKNFPIVFHGVIGEDMREDRSPSFFNPQEVVVVVESVDNLLNAKGFRVKQKDIGVISPYRKQVMKIRSVFKKKKWDDIKVGSTEEFQGQERLVIIISTVRSCTDFLNVDFTFSLGFLSHPKRFNVAVTRAKALLIMIGNPNILSQDIHWRSMIEYCLTNGSFLGEKPLEDDDEEMEDMFRRFKELGLTSALEPPAEAQISEREFQENPEWRADY